MEQIKEVKIHKKEAKEKVGRENRQYGNKKVRRAKRLYSNEKVRKGKDKKDRRCKKGRKDKDRDKKSPAFRVEGRTTAGQIRVPKYKGGGCLLSRIALQYHRRKRA